MRARIRSCQVHRAHRSRGRQDRREHLGADRQSPIQPLERILWRAEDGPLQANLNVGGGIPTETFENGMGQYRGGGRRGRQAYWLRVHYGEGKGIRFIDNEEKKYCWTHHRYRQVMLWIFLGYARGCAPCHA